MYDIDNDVIWTTTVIYVSCSLRRVIINRIREFLIVFIIYIGQGKFQDTKGETEAVNQKKQYNGQKKKNKRRKNDL